MQTNRRVTANRRDRGDDYFRKVERCRYNEVVCHGRGRLKELIGDEADGPGLEILGLAICPDRVRPFIAGDPTLATSGILRRVNAKESRAVGVSGIPRRGFGCCLIEW